MFGGVSEGAWKPFDAPPGCPCTPRLLCQYDQRQVMEPGCDIPLHPKRTYSMHGGAGGLFLLSCVQFAGLVLGLIGACLAVCTMLARSGNCAVPA